MANSITRFFKVIWYTITGRARGRSNKRMANPETVRGIYEDIIRYKQSCIQRYKHAIGHLIALIEQKKGLRNELTNGIVLLEEEKAGAIAKSKSTAAKLQKAGVSEEEIEQHPDFIRCVTACNDLDRTLAEEKVHVAKIEQDLERLQNDIEDHKFRITGLHRDLKRFKIEQSEAVAELITARERQEVANTLAGDA